MNKSKSTFLDYLIAYNYGAIAACTMFVILHGVCHLAKYLHDHGLLN